MSEEFQALLKTQTWTLVPSNTSPNVLGVKWVSKTKRHANGSIERRKVRLVAKGYHQVHGVDYGETFSPVAKPSTIRLLLSLAEMNEWSVRQLDIHNAFLHGNLKEDVFINQPPSFTNSQFPSHICKLHKSLYGLKQAPRAWFSRLSDALITMGFTPSQADSSLFIYRHGTLSVFVLVYVDDLLVFSSDNVQSDRFVSALSQQFPVKDLGPLNFFLGIEARHDATGIYLSQSKYIQDLVSHTDMTQSKGVSTPMATTFVSSLDDSKSFEDTFKYRSIVGGLQYLAFTRPDISFSLNRLCQFMHSLMEKHWQGVKRVLRYLNGTAYMQFHLSSVPSFTISAFSDADWVGDPVDRRSTRAYCIFHGSNLVSWASKKQPMVSRSSTEAEHRAMAVATCELLQIQSLVAELKVPLH